MGHGARGLRAMVDIETYHSFGYYGLFKPTIAEVVACIPPRYLESTVAFQMLEYPRDAEDLNMQWSGISLGVHTAKVRLFQYCKYYEDSERIMEEQFYGSDSD